VIQHIFRATIVGAILLATAAVEAYADPVIDWNMRANEIVVESKIGTAMGRQIGTLAAQKHFAP
jgi:hypothetical protein